MARPPEPSAVRVALKVLLPGLASDPRRRAQFRREAELGARLRGPGLLPVLDAGAAGGVEFLVMPLIDGYSLREVIAQRRESPGGRPSRRGHWRAHLHEGAYVRSVVRVLARVARTVQDVHSHRVVHRDIKPANILLHRYCWDRVFLCDFGLGLDADTADRSHGGSGTPLYMAPEKLLSRGDVDEERCDIYALGVTLFEAVALAPPFSVPEQLPRRCLAMFLASSAPSRPRSIREGVPEDLEGIILRAMDPEPGRRYATAAALADDLDRFLLRAPSGPTGEESPHRSP